MFMLEGLRDIFGILRAGDPGKAVDHYEPCPPPPPRLERAQEDADNQKSASIHVRTMCMCYPPHTSQ